MLRTALFDPTRRYRYTLRRVWEEDEPVAAFIGLNPSTATELEDDPTVRRCIRFSRDWGYGGLVMLNAFGLRSTDPRGLLEPDDPTGPDNLDWIAFEACSAGIVVAAWGAHAGALGLTLEPLLELLEPFDLHALGFTAGGHPRHPLYVRADTKPVLWRPAAPLETPTSQPAPTKGGNLVNV